MKILRHKDGDQGGAPSVTVDLDILSEPDNGEKPLPKIEPDKPQVDPPGQQQQPGGQQPAGDPPKPETLPVGDASKNWDDLKADRMYAFAKEKYSKFLPEDYKDPENISLENVDQHIAEMAYHTANWEDMFHPEVRQLQEAVAAFDGDFDKALDEYTKHRSWKTMPDENLLKWHYKENLKIPDDKLDAALKGMNHVVEAAKVRKELEGSESDWIRQQDEIRFTQDKQKRDKDNLEREQEINTALEVFGKKSDIWGIPLDAKLKEEFPTVFKRWVTPGQDGISPIAKLLANSEFLTGIVLMAEKQDGPVKELIFNTKQNIKEGIKAKLDPEPNFKPSAVIVDPKKIDFDRLTEPDDGKP